jgi:hypothetical protein
MSATNIGDELIAYFAERTAAVSSAAGLVSAYALGLGAFGSLVPIVGNGAAPRTITLELTNVPFQSVVAANPQNPNPASNPSLPPTPPVTTSNSTNVANVGIAAVALDVIPQAQGWPQRISYKMSARQSEQQTFTGFHVLEYGYAIGVLDVDCLVNLGGSPFTAIKPFFDLIYLAKQTRPLDNGNPTTLRYHDSYLGKTFVITQRDVTLQESADQQGMARLIISAGILYDYDMPSVSVQPPSVPSVAAQVAGVTADFEALQNFAAGATVGLG